MTIDRRWLEDYLKGLRICNMMEEQERLILSLFSTEPDERHSWSEQDICEQIRKILENVEISCSTGTGGGV